MIETKNEPKWLTLWNQLTQEAEKKGAHNNEK